MTKDEYLRAIRLCTYGHHKIRQNNFGVCWCVRCGYLFKSIEYTKLQQSDIMIVDGKETPSVRPSIEGVIPEEIINSNKIL